MFLSKGISMGNSGVKLTRIGVFYDGNYFFHASNYYNFYHQRRSRISIAGLHNFIRQEVAKVEGSDPRYCQIVDAHYFRGRLRATEAEQRDLLLRERQFDDILIREGVVAHYLPLNQGGEKGVDVWLALEAFELAIYKKFDITVLVAGDGDFLPLVRKLNTLGTRVALVGWDFKFTDQNGSERETRMSQSLLGEVTYPLMMHQVIDDRSRRDDPLVNGLFIPARDARTSKSLDYLSVALLSPIKNDADTPTLGKSTGKVLSLKDGYGFVRQDSGGDNLFFHYTSVIDDLFNALQLGSSIKYETGQNEKGPCAKEVELID
jgi:cold shock CspA family protein